MSEENSTIPEEAPSPPAAAAGGGRGGSGGRTHRRRRSVVEFEKKAQLKAALRDCTRRGSGGALFAKRHSSYHLGGNDSADEDDDDDDSESEVDEWYRSDEDSSDEGGSEWNVSLKAGAEALMGLNDGGGEKAEDGGGGGEAGPGGMKKSSSRNKLDGGMKRSSSRNKLDADGAVCPLPYALDWVTENMDVKSSLPQTYDDELERLTVLNSYMLLDSEREASFERITALCSRIFDVPISLVSLVDIGRQWFMSNRGLGDVRETSRKLAFCSHCVQSTNDLLIVPDAPLDPRFENNDLVTGPPHIRFYAGAPLVSPEGFRLGTLCVIDVKTRPDGLTMSQQQTLRELAAMVVEEMVRRRDDKRRTARDASRILAETATEMLVPLERARKAVQGLVGGSDANGLVPGLKAVAVSDLPGVDAGGGGAADRAELGKVAEACFDVMGRICEKAVESYDAEQKDGIKETATAASNGPRRTSSNLADDEDDNDAIVSVSALADNLRRVVIGPEKKKKKKNEAKIEVEVDPEVPAEIVSDDMKLFRSALNYLTSAVDRVKDRSSKTKKGNVDIIKEEDGHTSSSTVSSVKLKFFVKHKAAKRSSGRDKSYLVCECEDTGEALDPAVVDGLFAGKGTGWATGKGGKFGLLPVADSVDSLGGKFGYRPKEGWGNDDPHAGNVFWFTVPLVVPYASKTSEAEERGEIKGTSNSPAAPGANQLPGKGAARTGRRGSSKVLSVPSSASFDRDAVYEAVEKAMANKDKAPAAAGEGPEDAKQEPDASIGAGHRALVIDDSPLVRDVISGALLSLGFAVSTASDGMEGLQSMQASQFDVVFCDFLMPIYDGPDCIEQYREWETKNRPGAHQRIVGLSDCASAEDVKRATNAGMDGVVTKSSKMSDLLKDALGLVESMEPRGGKTRTPATAGTGASGMVPGSARPVTDEDRSSGTYPATHDLPRMPMRSFRPAGGAISMSSALSGVNNNALTSVAAHQAYSSQRRSRRNDAMSRLFS